MHRSFATFALLSSALVVLGCGTTPPARVAPVYHAGSTFETEAQRVLIVSMDGLRPDAIEKADTPHLHSMQDAGTHTETAQAVFPSITLVNHTSMVSGVSPAKHGIDWNDYLPEKGELKVPTVFDLAKQKGLSTALVAGKEKFKHLNRPGTIDHFEVEEGTPFDVSEKAISILREEAPRLMVVHFRHPDSVGHEKGWMSPEQIQAIGESDHALGLILGALNELGMLESTAVILSADHGGHDMNHGTTAPVDMTIPWIAVGAEIPGRGALKKGVTTFDTAATAADLLELDIPSDWDGASAFAE